MKAARLLAWWRQQRIGGLELLLATYALVGLWLLPGYRYQINPDGVSYIDLARLYAGGHLWTAVNAYWSPLYSWLMAPLVRAGVDPLIAGKLWQLAGGAGLLAAFWRLARHWRPRWLVAAFAAAMGVVSLSWALTYGATPDLLLAALVVGWVVCLTQPGYVLSARWAVLAGVLAGLAYLTKSYALPFALLFGGLWHGWHIWRWPSARRRWVRQAIISGVVASVILAPWIALISAKEHRLTTGTAGNYALALFGPARPLQPMFTRGLLAPPPGGTSVWTDPTLLDLTPPGKRAWLSPDYLWFLKAQADKNLVQFWQIVHDTWLLWVTGLLLGLVTIWGGTAGRRRRQILGLAGGMVLFSAGYLVIFVEARYLWPVLALGVLVGLAGLVELYRRWPYGPHLFQGIVALAVVLLVQSAVARLQEQRHLGAIYPLAAQQIRDALGSEPRVIASRGHWDESLYMSYYLDATYAGMLPPGGIEESYAQLASWPVDIILVWDDPRRGVPDYPGCVAGQTLGLAPVTIYTCDAPR